MGGIVPSAYLTWAKKLQWFEDEVMIWLKSRQRGPFAAPARPANEIVENATPANVLCGNVR